MHNVFIGSTKIKPECALFSLPLQFFRSSRQGVWLLLRQPSTRRSRSIKLTSFFYDYFISNITVRCNTNITKFNQTKVYFFLQCNLQLTAASPGCGCEVLFKIANFLNVLCCGCWLKGTSVCSGKNFMDHEDARNAGICCSASS